MGKGFAIEPSRVDAVEYRVVEYPHGVAIFSDTGIPLDTMVRLWKAYRKGNNILDIGIAHHLGALSVLTSKTKAKLWRQQIAEVLLRRYPDDPERRWLEGVDYGTSAFTIFRSLADHPTTRFCEGARPSDADDFGRCLRLVESMGWQDILGEVSRSWPKWKPIVDHWDELAKLYHAKKLEEVSNRLRAMAGGQEV